MEKWAVVSSLVPDADWKDIQCCSVELLGHWDRCLAWDEESQRMDWCFERPGATREFLGLFACLCDCRISKVYFKCPWEEAAGILQSYHALGHFSALLHCMNELIVLMPWLESLPQCWADSNDVISSQRKFGTTVILSKLAFTSDLALLFPWRCPANCYHMWLLYWLRM